MCHCQSRSFHYLLWTTSLNFLLMQIIHYLITTKTNSVTTEQWILITNNDVFVADLHSTTVITCHVCPNDNGHLHTTVNQPHHLGNIVSLISVNYTSAWWCLWTACLQRQPVANGRFMIPQPSPPLATIVRPTHVPSGGLDGLWTSTSDAMSIMRTRSQASL